MRRGGIRAERRVEMQQHRNPEVEASRPYDNGYLSASLIATSIFHLDLRGSTLGSVR